MADLATDAGLPLAEYAAETRAALGTILPDFGTVDNPLDLTGGSLDREGVYPEALAAVARDPNIGLIAIYQGMRGGVATPSEDGASSGRAPLAQAVAAMARATDTPVIAFTTVTSGTVEPAVRAALDAGRVPLLQGPEFTVRAIASALRYAAFLRHDGSGALAPERAPVPAAATQPVERLRSTGALSEHWAKQLLAAYGIPVTRGGIARTSEEAERLAAELGYPVALKAASPRLLHKTERGLVRLGVRDAGELRATFAALWQRAEACLDADLATLEGVLVQEMVPLGVEVIVGARNTEFGPVVIFGAGGLLAELVQDTSVRLAPVSEAEARMMIAETRVGRLLGGMRGQAPIDVASVARVIVQVSRLAGDLGDALAELDVNPLIVSTNGVVAVDAAATATSPAR
jgi:acetyltransferase